MAEEKIFIINLRREFSKKPNYKRSKKAVTAVKEYIQKHLKVDDVKIGKNLNLKIWERGRKNPPPKIKVKAVVEEDIAYVELPEFEFDIHRAEEKTKKVEKPDTEEAAEEAAKKEKEKEIQKDLKHEEEAKHKKEHGHEVIERPEVNVKPREKIREAVKKQGRIIGSTGKK